MRNNVLTVLLFLVVIFGFFGFISLLDEHGRASIADRIADRVVEVQPPGRPGVVCFVLRNSQGSSISCMPVADAGEKISLQK